MIFDSTNHIEIKTAPVEIGMSYHIAGVQRISIQDEDIPDLLFIESYKIDKRPNPANGIGLPEWSDRYKITINGKKDASDTAVSLVFESLNIATKYFDVLINLSSYKNKNIKNISDILPELFV